MFGVILAALLPVAVTLALGAIAGWDGDENASTVGSLNTMVLRYALPVSLFAGTATTPLATLFQDGRLALLLTAAMMVPFVAVLVISHWVVRRDLGTATLQALAVASPAIPFVGLPILSPMLGSGTTAVIAVASIVVNVVQMPMALVLLGSDAARAKAGSRTNGTGTSPVRIVVEALLQPVVLAPLAALVLVLTGVTLPTVVLDGLKLLGATVGGVALFAAGVILQAHRPVLTRPMTWSLAGHLVLPLGVLGLAVLAGTSPTLRSDLVLPMALPGGAAVVILAVRFATAEREAATFLLGSYVLSFPVLAILDGMLSP